MSEFTQKNKSEKNDEIDLLDLFRRFGRQLQKLGKALKNGVLISAVFLIKNWLPLGISIIAGAALSYAFKVSSPSFYTSDLVLKNNLVQIDKKTLRDVTGTTAELITKINKLHLFCIERNTLALSQAIAMNPEMANNIDDISAYWVIDQNNDGISDYIDYKGSHNVYDTVNVRVQNSIDIRVKINSSLDLNHVRNGILKFIESDSLFQRRNHLRLRQNNELLIRYNSDIKQLDSLQKVKYFEETRNMKPANGGQIIFMQEQNTQLVYNDIYNIYTMKQKLENETDLFTSIVTILSDFSTPTKRENGAMYYGKNIIPVFFLGMLLFLILRANKKRLKDVYEKY
jgi:hypothetical protein